MDRVHQEYTSRSTWKLVDVILESGYLYTKVREAIEEDGDLTGEMLKELVYGELWVDVHTNLLDVDWQQVADEINAN